MPNATHQRLAATATRLIAVHGRTMQLVQKTAGSSDEFDPFASFDAATTETLIPVVAVMSRFSANDTDGVQIQKNDKQILMDSRIKPTAQMMLDDDGLRYSIVDVAEVKPGETACLYKLQVRV